MIIDAHMHIWDRIHGLVNGELPVRSLGSGMISIGEEKMLGMPATLNDCQALAEYVIGEFDFRSSSRSSCTRIFDGPQNDYLLAVQKLSDRFFRHALPNFFDWGCIRS